MNINIDANTNTVSVDTFQYNTTEEPAVSEMPGLHNEPKRNLKTGEYALILNPNTHLDDDVLSYSYCERSILDMFDTLDINTGRFQRIDFAYDSYIPGIYKVMYKTNLVFMALIANEYKTKNTYSCKQLFSSDENSINIKGQYFDIECYDKELEEPEGKVKCRLEFRAKRVTKALQERKGLKDAELPIDLVMSETWNRISEMITKSITVKSYNEVVNRFTEMILTEFSNSNLSGRKKDIDLILFKNLDKVVNTKQLESIYEAVGYTDAKQKAMRFSSKYKLERVSLRQLKLYSENILKCGKIFFEN